VRGLFLTLPLVVVAASGCGSGETDSADSAFKANVVKFVANEVERTSEYANEEESLCLAEKFVDVVGVDDALTKAVNQSLLSDKEAEAWVRAQIDGTCIRLSEKMSDAPSDFTSEQLECIDAEIASSEDYVSASVELLRDPMNWEIMGRVGTALIRVFFECGVEIPDP